MTSWGSGLATSWGSRHDRNNVFVKYVLESQAYTLQARENGKAHASVCVTIKSVLLLDSSRNISSIDEVPSQ